MTDIQLAQLSNNAVAAAIAVFCLALVASAAVAAAARTRRRSPVREPAMVGVGMAGVRVAQVGVAEVGVDVGVGARSDADRHVDASRLSVAQVRTARASDLLVGLGTLLLVLAVTTRGLAVGRAPWGNMYEFTLAAALAAAVALTFGLRNATIRPLAPWAVALVVLALGLAVTVLWTPTGELVPVLDSYWLVVHVAAAITAGGIFTLGFVTAAAYLVRSRGGREAGALDRVSYTVHLVAFPIWTFAVIAGAIWAENAWGRYWGWDPKETWAFITWVIYAAYLHAQATPRWRGRRAAVLAVLGYLAFLFNFFGVNLWIAGLHSYAGV